MLDMEVETACGLSAKPVEPPPNAGLIVPPPVVGLVEPKPGILPLNPVGGAPELQIANKSN